MIKEEIEDHFKLIRQNITEDHNEGKISDADLIEKLNLLKEMEREATEIILTVKKLTTRRNE